MQIVRLNAIARHRRGINSLFLFAALLLAFSALTIATNPPVLPAQDAKPALLPPMPAAPSPGKAIVCIYRTYNFIGSAAHDHLYVNGVYLAYLLNDEYAWTEVAPGTVVITGLPKMYYGGIIQSTGAALNEATKKENERARFEAEAGKIYYFKWTSSTMATGIKITAVDEATGAKNVKKLHPSKLPSEKDQEPKDSQAPKESK